MRFRGATGAAHAPKPDKTPDTAARPPLPPLRSILQNLGKTAVLRGLPPMASVLVLCMYTVSQFKENDFLLHEFRMTKCV
jgi:hypothetical protein